MWLLSFLRDMNDLVEVTYWRSSSVQSGALFVFGDFSKAYSIHLVSAKKSSIAGAHENPISSCCKDIVFQKSSHQRPR